MLSDWKTDQKWSHQFNGQEYNRMVFSWCLETEAFVLELLCVAWSKRASCSVVKMYTATAIMCTVEWTVSPIINSYNAYTLFRCTGDAALVLTRSLVAIDADLAVDFVERVKIERILPLLDYRWIHMHVGRCKLIIRNNQSIYTLFISHQSQSPYRNKNQWV